MFANSLRATHWAQRSRTLPCGVIGYRPRLDINNLYDITSKQDEVSWSPYLFKAS